MSRLTNVQNNKGSEKVHIENPVSQIPMARNTSSIVKYQNHKFVKSPRGKAKKSRLKISNLQIIIQQTCSC